MGKTVLVTGINSYAASTLLPKLDADPDIDKIIGIDVTPWKGGWRKVDFHKADIRDPSVTGLLKDVFNDVAVVFYLAAAAGGIVLRSRSQNTRYDINGNGPGNIFAACVGHHVKKVIYVVSPDENDPDQNDLMAPGTKRFGTWSKTEAENVAAEIFNHHPDITLTVLRSAMVCGPNIPDLVSTPWFKKIRFLPPGSKADLRLVHEEDLGEALYLAYRKDLPGEYHVASDDTLPVKWFYRQAGVRVIPIPSLLLKFRRRNRVSGSRHPMSARTRKFEDAAGWRPRYSSKETFESYITSRVRDAEDNLIQSILSWVFASGARIRPTMTVLHIFRLGKIKAFRNHFPWMSPKKNSMTYLPVSYKPVTPTRRIAIDETAGESASEILPAGIVHEFIEKANVHVIMDHCGCRLAGQCNHFTADIGCLFMGETAHKLPHGVSRRVTRDQAHRHVDRAVGVGLVPVVGKIRVDNFIFLTPDKNRLLSVCFCCHCCCMMGAFRHLPGEHLDQVMTPLEGVSIRVTHDCVGCGTCLETCIFNAISIENGRAVHSNRCRACGRCATACPQSAVKITFENPKVSTEAAKQRIESFVQVA